jgi:hypothetical protein
VPRASSPSRDGSATKAAKVNAESSGSNRRGNVASETFRGAKSIGHVTIARGLPVSDAKASDHASKVNAARGNEIHVPNRRVKVPTCML